MTVYPATKVRPISVDGQSMGEEIKRRFTVSQYEDGVLVRVRQVTGCFSEIARRLHAQCPDASYSEELYEIGRAVLRRGVWSKGNGQIVLAV